MNFIFIGNISPGAVTGGYLINLAPVAKTKRKNIIEFQQCTGMKNKIEKNPSYFFFNFQKIGLGGSVKRKIKNSGLILYTLP